jgi:hypothetical protein
MGDELEVALREIREKGFEAYVEQELRELMKLLERKAYYISKRYWRDETLQVDMWNARYSLHRIIQLARMAQNVRLAALRRGVDNG